MTEPEHELIRTIEAALLSIVGTMPTPSILVGRGRWEIAKAVAAALPRVSAATGSVDEAMVERALKAMHRQILDGRPPWNEDDKKQVRAMLTAATVPSPAQTEGCTECMVNLADPPSKLCPGCQAYREHQQ